MAVPTITGTVVRKIRLHHASAGSDKEYVITVTEENGRALVFTEYGPSGRLNNGRCETPSPVSRLSASSKADSLKLAKQNHRKTPYTVVSDDEFNATPPSPPPSPAPSSAPFPQASTPVRSRPVGNAAATILNWLL